MHKLFTIIIVSGGIIVVLYFLWVLLIAPKFHEYDCGDFKTYTEAFKILQKHDTDVYHLDGNNNGEPCEYLLRGS